MDVARGPGSRETTHNGCGVLLYDRVREHIEFLVPRFDLRDSRDLISQAFDLLGRDSLAIPLGGQPGYRSTLNEDGTPFQFALVLRPFEDRLRLQFLGEVGKSELSNIERRALAEEVITSLSRLFGCGREWLSCRGAIEEIAPRDSPELSSDPGGTFWVGVSCLRGEAPRLLVYINARWGSEDAAWCRLGTWADYLGVRDQWNDQQRLICERMAPLGVSLSLQAGRPPAGRIYVRGYGNPLRYYEQLANSAIDSRFAKHLQESARTLLGSASIYPTRSVVCSYSFQRGRNPDFKVEFCAHCAFSSDAEAVSRCLAWLEFLQMPDDPYLTLLNTLSSAGVSGTTRGLHSFVGLGSDTQHTYCTVYLNPGAAAGEGPQKG